MNPTFTSVYLHGKCGHKDPLALKRALICLFSVSAFIDETEQGKEISRGEQTIAGMLVLIQKRKRKAPW